MNFSLKICNQSHVVISSLTRIEQKSIHKEKIYKTLNFCIVVEASPCNSKFMRKAAGGGGGRGEEEEK